MERKICSWYSELYSGKYATYNIFWSRASIRRAGKLIPTQPTSGTPRYTEISPSPALNLSPSGTPRSTKIPPPPALNLSPTVEPLDLQKSPPPTFNLSPSGTPRSTTPSIKFIPYSGTLRSTKIPPPPPPPSIKFIPYSGTPTTKNDPPCMKADSI